MSHSAIKVENISKNYIINPQIEGNRYVTLKDIFTECIKSIIKKSLIL